MPRLKASKEVKGYKITVEEGVHKRERIPGERIWLTDAPGTYLMITKPNK